MPTPDWAALLAAALPTLTHPGLGDGPVALPIAAFQPATLPPEVAEHFANEAGLPHGDFPKLAAEAIIDTLGKLGGTIIDSTAVARLRSTDPVEATQQMTIHCTCGATLFTLQVYGLDVGKPTVYGGALVNALKRLSPDCGTGHRS